ncbi:putative bifunctional diguanylate cyclase/phosphodiesterase [Gellertiella hungarica]
MAASTLSHTREALSRHLAFIGFGAEDRKALTLAHEAITEAFVPALEHLYDQIRVTPEVAGLFRDEDAVERAKAAQRGHWLRLLSHGFDDTYIAEVLKIGEVHASLGVTPGLMVGAHTLLLTEALHMLARLSHDRVGPAAKSALIKCVLADIHFSIEVYHRELERARDLSETRKAEILSSQRDALDILEHAINEVAIGNLEYQIPTPQPGRFGVTVDNFNAAIRKQRQLVRQIEHKATHDPLTGLFNREHFFRCAQLLLDEARAGGGNVIVEMIDLDGFKLINDTLGHDVGDACLREVARRLRRLCGPEARIFRQGGDEFTVVRPAAADGADASEAYYERILSGLQEPIPVEAHILHVSASIGSADSAADPDSDIENLTRHADLALYEAKNKGKNRHCSFAPSLLLRALQSANIIASSHRALEEGRFSLHFQPKHDLATGHVVGAEGLLRMRGEGGEWLTPGAFGPALDDAAFQRDIGNFVLVEAVRAIRQCRHVLPAFGHVAINLDTAQFIESGFVTDLARLIEEREITADNLQIEVTERVIINDGRYGTARHLNALAALGISIALDDFGTGYASLNHLRSLPIDTVKIDRSFIRALRNSPVEYHITRAIVALGRDLRKTVVAEGIEDVETRALLVEMGCQIGQGYLFSPALCLTDFIAYCRQTHDVRHLPPAQGRVARG